LLSRTVQDLKDELDQAEMNFETVESSKDYTIYVKDDEIAALKAKMEDMALEFGSMLNGTLEKMHERIEMR
jgi:predicted RNase H-like nuclease (RuvC/YqgF family)